MKKISLHEGMSMYLNLKEERRMAKEREKKNVWRISTGPRTTANRVEFKFSGKKNCPHHYTLVDRKKKIATDSRNYTDRAKTRHTLIKPKKSFVVMSTAPAGMYTPLWTP